MKVVTERLGRHWIVREDGSRAVSSPFTSRIEAEERLGRMLRAMGRRDVPR